MLSLLRLAEKLYLVKATVWIRGERTEVAVPSKATKPTHSFVYFLVTEGERASLVGGDSRTV